jgi:hypothetical protein
MGFRFCGEASDGGSIIGSRAGSTAGSATGGGMAAAAFAGFDSVGVAAASGGTGTTGRGFCATGSAGAVGSPHREQKVAPGFSGAVQ